MAQKSKKSSNKNDVVYEIKIVDSEKDKFKRALEYCSNLLDIYNKVPAEVKFIVFEIGKNLIDHFQSGFLYKKNLIGEKPFKQDELIDNMLENIDEEILDEMIFVLENFENNYPKKFFDLLLEEKLIRRNLKTILD